MADQTGFFIEPLDPAHHNRVEFDCGVKELNDYLATKANQDLKRGAAGCWVLLEKQKDPKILGYYTLSPESVDAMDLPEFSPKWKKKLPRYPRIGGVLLGRLAISVDAQNKGLGSMLLMDALSRCLASEIPFVLVFVDPKDEKVAQWYGRFGFLQLTESRMVITTLELKSFFDSIE